MPAMAEAGQNLDPDARLSYIIIPVDLNHNDRTMRAERANFSYSSTGHGMRSNGCSLNGKVT